MDRHNEMIYAHLGMMKILWHFYSALNGLREQDTLKSEIETNSIVYEMMKIKAETEIEIEMMLTLY